MLIISLDGTMVAGLFDEKMHWLGKCVRANPEAGRAVESLSGTETHQCPRRYRVALSRGLAGEFPHYLFSRP